MKEILEMFSDPDGYREWMRQPFTLNGSSGATDGITLIITEGEIEGLQPISDKHASGFMGVIPNENIKIDFLLSDLKAICNKAPLVDEMKWKGEDIQCKACNGDGEVEFEFSFNYKDYYHDFDCPICDGSGFEFEETEVPTGNKIPDTEALIQFDFTRLKLKYFDRLIKVMEHEKEQSVTMVYHGDAVSPILFKAGKTKVLIMPVSPTDGEVIIHRFEINK